MSLEKKLALITGGASGIGLEVAHRLAQDGRNIAILDRDGAALGEAVRALSKKTKVWSRIVDVTVAQDVYSAVADLHGEVGPTSILVNNVGGSTAQMNADDIADDVFDEVIAANLKTAFYLTKAVAPTMKKLGWGRIVNYSSIAGRTFTPFTNAAYCAAKSGVVGLTKQCAYEFLQYGIAVNCVAHGPIGTERIVEAWKNRPEDSKQKVMGKIPAGRFGTIGEAADAVHFLCGEAAGYMVGACVDVNGGMYI